MKRARRRASPRLVWSIVLATFGSTFAGNLNPPGPPAPTMVTLQQIFDRQHPGSDTCFDNVGTNRFVDRGATAFGTRPVRNGR